jgi:hypothetical protein
MCPRVPGSTERVPSSGQSFMILKEKLMYRHHPENQLQCGYAMSTISSMPDLASLILIVSSWTRFTIVDVALMGTRRYLVVV